MRIIVNADDLGTSPGINDATFELMAMGRVSSATLIANAPSLDGALARIAEFPRCSFGIHLNLTVFPPLTSTPSLAALLDDNGKMSAAIPRAARRNKEILKAVYQELATQIERLLAAGVRLSHIDSHEHIHTLPVFFPVLKSLQRRYGIRRVRISKNVYLPGAQPGCAKSLKKWLYNTALRRIYPTQTTTAFTEFQSFYQMLRAGAPPRRESIELMAHPGTKSERYRIENENLKSNWVEELPPGDCLIGYNEL
jgi:predicted glycoside hydrolase/deacetylase ChbG (UPF0249 family)